MSGDNSNRIAFLHIPKTAGVSVIDAFVQRLGAESCHTFSSAISEESFKDKRFVSGHVHFGDIHCDAFIFAFVRDPLKQLASHLMWIDHYNQPEYEHELNGFPEKIKNEIRMLANVDFSSARSLDRYFKAIPRDAEIRVIDLQSEMLAFARGSITDMAPAALAKKAISNLDRLGFVGLSENLSAEMQTLFDILDLGPEPVISRLNSSPSSRRVDITAPDIKRTLLKYVQADLRLYEHVVDKKRDPLGSNRNIFSMLRSFARKYAKA
ncbi:sulfotransferase family 2 domain-containing protein [Burkholderia sp. Ac-20365]|uniref:sulfotransferase family 2 domain-containing protein n=1 Tax=Burkholderia sp. Ac-20365 TaxID=2703897 RepID=UPI00197B39A2|nr:sulfotransferase family 2 domain-containing protein [Burkholderia sp. Ac-20365]MBN3763255.1 sulfotransferase family 2 domain-containing protein [Burkholderia sp. Ac-20365]